MYTHTLTHCVYTSQCLHVELKFSAHSRKKKVDWRSRARWAESLFTQKLERKWKDQGKKTLENFSIMQEDEKLVYMPVLFVSSQKFWRRRRVFFLIPASPMLHVHILRIYTKYHNRNNRAIKYKIETGGKIPKSVKDRSRFVNSTVIYTVRPVYIFFEFLKHTLDNWIYICTPERL